jgi:uroporphyrinogen-III synthase
VLPLSKTTATDPGNLPDATGFDAVAVTSANALFHAPDDLAARYGALLCFTVGERTGEAVADAGFTKVISADGHVEALVALAAETLPAGARILYPCGVRRRQVLEAELGRLGHQVIALETYRTDPVKYDPSEVEAIAGTQPIDAALVYSPFGAERLSGVATMPELAPLFGIMRILCMSKQIANGLVEGLSGRAEIAASADEDALLALLGRARET